MEYVGMEKERYSMNTFTVLTPVCTSTGVVRIGKPHVITKREEVMAASYVDRIKEMNDKRRKK